MVMWFLLDSIIEHVFTIDEFFGHEVEFEMEWGVR